MGLKMSMRLILLLLISSILTFTTSPIVLTDGIEALLRPFKRFGVPAHELAMMMTIALRFIPTLLEETDRIMKAQTARGADFSSGNLMKRAKNMLPLLIPLFISAFRRADDLAVAMEARCYRGGEGRSRMHELVYYGRDYAALATVFVLIGLMAFIRWGERVMRTLKLTVAYDGTNYHGFQKQTNALTVQQVLEEKLSLLCGEKIVTAGSGRTDTGVHARGQVVSLTTSGSIPLKNLLKACAGILPKDIVLWQAEEADEGFHARYSACWKRYCYRIVQNKHADPFLRNYVWQMREYLRLEAMQEAAQLLLGTHDFSFFRSAGSVESSPVKTIYRAEWLQKEQGELEFCIEGNGFLYHMVRNIVWHLVEVGKGTKSIAAFKSEFAAGKRHFKVAPAPPQGLYLDYVGYIPHFLADIKKIRK